MNEIIKGQWDSEKRKYVHNGVDFDGHHVLWGFSYEPYTYLKESEISGDEYRKGGAIKFFKDNQQVYEIFWREPHTAVLQIGKTLLELMDFNWEKLKPGTKIYWRETPAKIKYVIWEQGAVVIEVDGVERFPDHVWDKEYWEKLEDPKTVKDDILSKSFWWYRN